MSNEITCKTEGIYTQTLSPGRWKIVCKGAGGGGGECSGSSSLSRYGYPGAKAEAVFDFPSNTTVKYVVGSAGLGRNSSNLSGYSVREDSGGSGGGMTGVVYNNELLIVAGGGGGGNWDNSPSPQSKYWDSSHDDNTGIEGANWDNSSRGLLASSSSVSYVDYTCAPSGKYGGGGCYSWGGGGGGFHGGYSYQTSDYLYGGQTGTCGVGKLFSPDRFLTDITGGSPAAPNKWGTGTDGSITFIPLSVGVPPSKAPTVNVNLVQVNKVVHVTWSSVPKVSVPNETTGGVKYYVVMLAVDSKGSESSFYGEFSTGTSAVITIPDKYLNPDDGYHFKVKVQAAVASSTGQYDKYFYGPYGIVDNIRYTGRSVNTVVLNSVPDSVDPLTTKFIEFSWSCEAQGASGLHYEIQRYDSIRGEWVNVTVTTAENHYSIATALMSRSIATETKLRVRAVVPNIKTGEWFETNTIKLLPTKPVPKISQVHTNDENFRGELCEVSWDKIEYPHATVKYLIRLVWDNQTLDYNNEITATSDTTFKTYIPQELITGNARFEITPFAELGNNIYKYGVTTASNSFSTARQPVIEVLNTEQDTDGVLKLKLTDPEGVNFLKELKILLNDRLVYVQTEGFTQEPITYNIDRHLLYKGSNTLKIIVSNKVDRTTVKEQRVVVQCNPPFVVNDSNLKLEAYTSFVDRDDVENFVKATKKLTGIGYASAESFFIGKGLANHKITVKVEMTRDTIPEKRYGSERYGIDSLKGAIQ